MLSPTGRFDFRTDYLDESLFPYERIQSIIHGLFNTQKAKALAPAPAQGDPALLDELSRQYQLPQQGMLMISGAQQGLDLVAKVFSAKISDAILFEDPTYPGAISLFKASHFVSMAHDGPDLEALDKKLGEPLKLFYTMPGIHNPTGIAYSPAKMQAVVERACQNDFFIIEDDYLGELLPSSPRFIDLCPQRTIYIKSFAQTTLAGIRLGFMVVPEELYGKFTYAKFSSDISSFGLLQRAWFEFIAGGEYARHLSSVRRLVDRRRRLLRRLIDRFDFLTIAHQQHGYSLWVHSRRQWPMDRVPWSKGEEFSFNPRYRSFFKISFMNMPEETFREGLAYLAGLFSA
jgi:DNA-binding transcriptional MocR family regulator